MNLKAFWRKLWKNRLYAIVNITGLFVGTLCFMVQFFYYQFETSFERFIPERHRIYRVVLEQYKEGERLTASAENYPGLAPAMLHEIPELESAARLYNLGYKNNVVITIGNIDQSTSFRERYFLYADSSFLSIMGYEVILGNAETALNKPNLAVLTESTAHKYFGDENPIGQTLRLQDDDFNDELAIVSAVVKDLPRNSHLYFDVLYSYSTLFSRTRGNPIQRFDQSWQRKDMYTYVKLKDGIKKQYVEEQIQFIAEKYNPDLAKTGREDRFLLQSIEDIHLGSVLADEQFPPGDRLVVNIIGLTGLFILCMAWINFVNLESAQLFDKAKATSVMTILGLPKIQLVFHYLMEIFFIHSVIWILALFCSWFLMPLVNVYFNVPFLTIQFTTDSVIFFIAILVIGTLCTGVYPVFKLALLDPLRSLKGDTRGIHTSWNLRKALVVIQFVISVALLSGSWIVSKQIRYLMTSPSGFTKEGVVVLDRPGVGVQEQKQYAIDAFRNDVHTKPLLTAVSASWTIPGKQREYKTYLKKYGEADEQAIMVRVNSMDDEFIDVYKLNLLAGRSFKREFVSDPDSSIIVSEETVRLLGFKTPEEAIKQKVNLGYFAHPLQIVGVVNDHSQLSLKSAMEPSVFFCSYYQGEYYSIRFEHGSIKVVLEQVKQAWDKAFPGNPFEYFFLDEYFQAQYANDMVLSKLIRLFSVIGVFISVLGVLGLAAYTAQHRAKEIAIRKVSGASIQSIMSLILFEYLKLITIALCIGVPLVYVLANNWLNGYAVSVSISGLEFLITAILLLAITLLAAGYYVIKASIRNPSTVLREN